MEVERGGQRLGVKLMNYLQFVSPPVGHAPSLLRLKGGFQPRWLSFQGQFLAEMLLQGFSSLVGTDKH